MSPYVLYTLNFSIDSASLQTLNDADLQITLAIPIVSASPNVRWLVLPPAATISLSWFNYFGLYSGFVNTWEEGSVISVETESYPAVDGATYGCDWVGSFEGPNSTMGLPPAPPAGSYTIVNESSAGRFIGLLNAPSINNGAMAVPSVVNYIDVQGDGGSVTLTPTQSVMIWLEAGYVSSSVLLTLPSLSSSFTFSASNATQSAVYSPNTGTFVPA